MGFLEDFDKWSEELNDRVFGKNSWIREQQKKRREESLRQQEVNREYIELLKTRIGELEQLKDDPIGYFLGQNPDDGDNGSTPPTSNTNKPVQPTEQVAPNIPTIPLIPSGGTKPRPIYSTSDPFNNLPFDVNDIEISYVQLPPRRLVSSTFVNSKPTKTTPDKVIKIEKACQDRDFGSLLNQPISKQKIEVVKYKQEKFKAWNENHKISNQNFANWLTEGNKHDTPWQDSAAILLHNPISSIEDSGNSSIGLMVGVKNIFDFMNEYHKRSISAYFPVRSQANTEVQFKEITEYDTGMSDLKIAITQVGLIDEVIGTNDFIQEKIELPPTLMAVEGSEEKYSKIINHVSLIEWYITVLDSLIGQFPIKVKVKDTDFSKEGDQELDVNFPNIAEMLAEIYGATISSMSNTDLTINILLRMASEVIATKNATLTSQEFAKANADYLGYKGTQVNRKAKSAFNLSDLEKMHQVLQGTEYEYIGWQNKDKNSVADYLGKLMFSASIIKSVFFHKDVDRVGKPLDDIDKDFGNNEEWLNFIRTINDPKTIFNQGDNPQPKVDNR